MVQYTLWETTVDIQIPKTVFPTKDEITIIDDILGVPCKHGYFKSPHHGKNLHYRRFIPSDDDDIPIKGIFLFQHGIKAEGGMACKMHNGEVYKVAVLAQMLTKAGYIFYTLDMLGHGFSEGERFYIPEANWTINRDDLASFALFVSDQEKNIQNTNNDNEQLPFFLGGESYGACLTLHVARKWMDQPNDCPSNFKGICIAAPAIIGDLPPKPVVILLSALAKVYPKWTPFFMPHPVSPERIWKNEQVRKEFTSGRRTEMGLDGSNQKFCLGTALGLLNALKAAREDVIPGLTVPFFVVHGTQDEGVPMAGTEYLLENASTPESDRFTRIIDGGYHCIFSEDDREETAKAMIDWMNKKAS